MPMMKCVWILVRIFLHKVDNSTPTIQDLLNLVAVFKDKDSLTSRLREWISILETNRNLADNELKQIAKIYTNFGDKNLSYFQALHKDLSLSNLIVKKKTVLTKPLFMTL